MLAVPQGLLEAAEARALALFAAAQLEIGVALHAAVQAPGNVSLRFLEVEEGARQVERWGWIASFVEQPTPDGMVLLLERFPELVEVTADGAGFSSRRALEAALSQVAARSPGRAPAGFLREAAAFLLQGFAIGQALTLDTQLFDDIHAIDGKLQVRDLMRGDRNARKLHDARGQLERLRLLHLNTEVAPLLAGAYTDFVTDAALGRVLPAVRDLADMSRTEQARVLVTVGLEAGEVWELLDHARAAGQTIDRSRFYREVREAIFSRLGDPAREMFPPM
jgi:hypothetical protein